MKKNTYQTLMRIAGYGLCIAGLIFLCLAIFGYEKAWTLPAALGCNALSLLFQTVCRACKRE